MMFHDERNSFMQISSLICTEITQIMYNVYDEWVLQTIVQSILMMGYPWNHVDTACFFFLLNDRLTDWPAQPVTDWPQDHNDMKLG